MTPSLIRAARGLLDWQQTDLAAAAKISLSAVNNFERGLGTTRATTIQSMIAALEEAGIEFLPAGGLRYAGDITGVQKFAGADFIQKMNEDIYASIRTRGQEIYTCSVDESYWFKPGVREPAQKYYEWRARMGVKELYLVAEGNNIFESSRQHYRFLPENLIGKITYTIYADRMALISWRKKQVFVLRGLQLVEPFREQFRFLWQLARKS